MPNDGYLSRVPEYIERVPPDDADDDVDQDEGPPLIENVESNDHEEEDGEDGVYHTVIDLPAEEPLEVEKMMNMLDNVRNAIINQESSASPATASGLADLASHNHHDQTWSHQQGSPPISPSQPCEQLHQSTASPSPLQLSLPSQSQQDQQSQSTNPSLPTNETRIPPQPSANLPVIAWPPIDHDPINEFELYGLASMCFILLFPLGQADPTKKARLCPVTETAAAHLVKYA
jgi:hypothetical protein